MPIIRAEPTRDAEDHRRSGLLSLSLRWSTITTTTTRVNCRLLRTTGTGRCGFRPTGFFFCFLTDDRFQQSDTSSSRNGFVCMFGLLCDSARRGSWFLLHQRQTNPSHSSAEGPVWELLPSLSNNVPPPSPQMKTKTMLWVFFFLFCFFPVGLGRDELVGPPRTHKKKILAEIVRRAAVTVFRSILLFTTFQARFRAPNPYAFFFRWTSWHNNKAIFEKCELWWGN